MSESSEVRDPSIRWAKEAPASDEMRDRLACAPDGVAQEAPPPPKQRARPLGDRLVVRPAAAEEKTAGGLVIPEAARDKVTRGTVLDVGAGRVDGFGQVRVPMEVRAGDVIVFGRFAGERVKVNGEELVVLRENEVLVVLELAP